MAEIIVSSFISVIFDKLASAALETLSPYVEFKPDIKKLQRSLYQIRNVLVDASQKEITDQYVKQWLNDLQQLAYDIDDVLDEIATEAMHRELSDELETHTNKATKFLSGTFSKHSFPTRNMKEKIIDITTKLQDLLEDKDALNLVLKAETTATSRNVNRKLQTSLVDVSSIVGRQAEKDELIRKLLRDEGGRQNFSIVPIVGMGGVGKTTLARLLYNEQQVRDHFELKAWVCISNDFDSFRISQEIFEATTGVKNELQNFNQLQEALKEHLRGKSFLLVLDDVWSENCEDWDTLIGPFHECASGSKIIITTRKEHLLKMLGYSNLNQLRRLSHADALSLLALYAFGVNNFNSHLSLKPHGEGIVEKCDGLPLALKAVGRLLSTKEYEAEYWNDVLNSDIWRLQVGGEIVPALRLSYHDLSAHLKLLFAYCSLFPKDYVFGKEELVQLWMAEGFLQHSTPNDSTEECLGHEYFDELLSRSFFQQAPNNESLFVMHDLMNDLALCVAEEVFLRLEKNIEKEALEKYRHMSFLRETYIPCNKFEAFDRATSLRTFLATSTGYLRVAEYTDCSFLSYKILDDLLPKLPLLRVLCLSNIVMQELPETIGTLKHLRYLNVSRTAIRYLPNNICNLYNLQTLILFSCRSLTKLPNNFSKLKTLRHFDIRDTLCLKKMPFGISELKSLQTLSKVIIGVEDGIEISKLKDFKNLCGSISIVGLNKVQNAVHAREANISQKRFSELELVWSDVFDGSRNEILEKEILNELKPRNEYLKQLKFCSYGGLEFPRWVGDPSFLQLKHMTIRGCKSCTYLPSLGQLPSLKELFIESLHGLKALGLELLGTSHAFPSLDVLAFDNMPKWEKWSMNNGVVFPCLQKLIIKDCPNLAKVTLKALPSLNVLEIVKCDSSVLKSLVQTASSITKLVIRCISRLNDVVWRGITAYLGEVDELSIGYCNEIRYLWESEVIASEVLVNLRKLEVENCGQLLSLGEKEEENDNYRTILLTSLRILKVYFCKNMVSCVCPDNIETLSVKSCWSVKAISLPRGGHKLKSLEIHDCDKLLEREWGGQKVNNKNTSVLANVDIRFWPNLKSIVGLDYLVHLTRLCIKNCESLESFPHNELSNLTSLKELEIKNCQNMDATFPSGIWPPRLYTLKIGWLKKPMYDWGPQNFPTSLVSLELYGDDGVTSSGQFSHLLPSSLTHLTIREFVNLESVGLQHLTSLQNLMIFNCSNLKELSSLQHLTSLQYLWFLHCPNIIDLSEMLLPSLLSLTIIGCPKLKERCSKGGRYWPLISHIPCLMVL